MPSRRTFLAALSTLPLPGVLAGCLTEADLDVADEGVGESADGICRSSTRDAEGPFYLAGAPHRAALVSATERGTKLVVEGRLLDTDCLSPLRNMTIDLWQADVDGEYSMDGAAEDFRLRGKVTTDASGRFSATTIMPGRYADSLGRFRPAHIHAKIFDRGRRILTTQLYFAGDPYLGRRDFCTREGTCNSSDVSRIARVVTVRPDGGDSFLRAAYDLVIA